MSVRYCEKAESVLVLGFAGQGVDRSIDMSIGCGLEVEESIVVEIHEARSHFTNRKVGCPVFAVQVTSENSSALTLRCSSIGW